MKKLKKALSFVQTGGEKSSEEQRTKTLTLQVRLDLQFV